MSIYTRHFRRDIAFLSLSSCLLGLGSPMLDPGPSGSQAINRLKWTPRLLSSGWILLPNVIVEKQRELGLDPIDLNIVLHLAAHWWTPDVWPRPSKARLAAAMNLSLRTLQRRLSRLDKKGLVKRIPRGTTSANRNTNAYDLSGLIEKATPLAEEMWLERDLARKQKSTAGEAMLWSEEF